MKRTIKRWTILGSRPMRWFVVVVALSLTAISPAWAKGKKIEVVEEATKGYALPYAIVLTLVGMGLMTVLRPGKRLDKADEKLVSDEEE